jgi:POT family proton-dependent oligopeptide transporter
VLLQKFGPKFAFGMPAVAMGLATIVFWSGRKKYAVVPPAGRAWLRDVLSPEGLKTIGSLAIIYFFVAFFWALWDQSNGQTWTLQAQSSLMDKNLGFGLTVLPAQIQVVNGLFILGMVPIFTFAIYPLMGRVFKVTPLRKIGIGLFVTGGSFLIVAWIESKIQHGQRVSAWWQIVAYLVVTAGEVLVSITALEFSYKQAPLRMKSFIMSLFLLSTSIGNLMTAGVNRAMVKPVPAAAMETGATTWVKTTDASSFVQGQKIDFAGDTGIKVTLHNGKTDTLAGTYLVRSVGSDRLELMDVIDREPVSSIGAFDAAKAQVSTYRLVGPQYFVFFTILVSAMGVIFIFVAARYKERTHLRDEAGV